MRLRFGGLIFGRTYLFIYLFIYLRFFFFGGGGAYRNFTVYDCGSFSFLRNIVRRNSIWDYLVFRKIQVGEEINRDLQIRVHAYEYDFKLVKEKK